MASLLRQILRNLGGRLDEDLLPGLYHKVSLSTEEIRREFIEAEVPFCDVAVGRSPPPEELQATASALIRRAVKAASVRGALGGVSGLASIPPEVAIALVQTLRLAQRLAVLYGVELETDRGRLLLSRILATGYQLELPAQQALDIKISHLPQVARQQLPDVQRTGAWLARSMVWQLTRHLGGRLSRVLPGVGAGVGAWDAHRSLTAQGERMLSVLQRSVGVDLPLNTEIEDAEEVAEVEQD